MNYNGVKSAWFLCVDLEQNLKARQETKSPRQSLVGNLWTHFSRRLHKSDTTKYQTWTTAKYKIRGEQARPKEFQKDKNNENRSRRAEEENENIIALIWHRLWKETGPKQCGGGGGGQMLVLIGLLVDCFLTYSVWLMTLELQINHE